MKFARTLFPVKSPVVRAAEKTARALGVRGSIVPWTLFTAAICLATATVTWLALRSTLTSSIEALLTNNDYSNKLAALALDRALCLANHDMQEAVKASRPQKKSATKPSVLPLDYGASRSAAAPES